MCLMSHWPIMSRRDSLLTLTISLDEIKGKMSKLPLNYNKVQYILLDIIGQCDIKHIMMLPIDWLIGV
jgi:hypothetical protein